MRDWLRSLPGRDQTRRRPASIVPVTMDNVHRVRLSWYGDFSLRQLERHLEAHPGLAFMTEGGEAHIVGGYWRRRREIGSVLAISPGSYGPALANRLIEAYRQQGAALVVADYQVQPYIDLFISKGFEVIETIVRYERSGCEVRLPTRDVALRPYTPRDIEAVLKIERESFPWLWWNSREELAWYSQLAGVEIWVLFDGAQPIGYSGFTITGRDGHLDRIAIRRDWQGKGYGAAILANSLRRMGALGVERVALSTQSTNRVSQSMYRRFGFRRSHWSYDIHGLWLNGEAGGEAKEARA